MATLEVHDYSHLLEDAFVQETFFSARLVGISPLLMHNPQGMRLPDGEVKRKKKEIPTPHDEAEMGAYRLPDGTLCLPTVAVQRAMIEAGKAFQNPDNKRATSMKLVAAALSLPEVEGFPLIDPDTDQPITEYEIDTRRAVVQRAAIMRSRPKVFPWAAQIELGFDPGLIKLDLLAKVLQVAGRQVGLLDYRPEKSGPFGRFRVESLHANT